MPETTTKNDESITDLQLSPDDTELTTQEVIRSEVNLLNLPFFALWDKDIHKRKETNYSSVVQRGDQKLEISWTVAAHQRYGYPGPFDKKVHRAVEQIINELRPPVENPVAIGSLYRIAALLQVKKSTRGNYSGRVYEDIKESLARITAIVFSD